jgi:GNAT superfamily N-acetyltransferase
VRPRTRVRFPPPPCWSRGEPWVSPLRNPPFHLLRDRCIARQWATLATICSRATRCIEWRGVAFATVIEIREIGEDELADWVAVSKAAGAEPGTVEDYLDWRRQAEETAWLLATLEGEPAGTTVVLTGWHSPSRVGRFELSVVPAQRRRGVGSLLLAAAGTWLRERECDEALAPVRENDADSLAWAERRGYREIGRDSLLALDVSAVEAPAVEPPEGIDIVSWAERPELTRGMYDVACEAYPDVPGEDEGEMASFEDWLSVDMQGTGDRPEATFLVLEGDEVVGYAKFSISNAPGRGHARHHRGKARLASARYRGDAQARRDPLGEGERLHPARDAERGAERADPAAERAARISPRAGQDHGPRPCLTARFVTCLRGRAIHMNMALRNRKGRWQRMRRLGETRLTWIAVGAASGAAAAFFTDPQAGARRRALARDRTASAIRRFAQRSARGTRIAGAYGAGWSKRLRHLREEPKDLDDATLAQKVQSEIFRPADAPKGTVDVNVANGVVQLRGEVERPELIDDLVGKVRKIQGVRDVESFLHLPHTPAPPRI